MIKCEVAILGSGIAATTAAIGMQKANVDFKLVHDPSSVKHRPIWISKDYTSEYPETKIGMRQTESVRLVSSEIDFRVPHEQGKYWIINPVKTISALKKRIDPNKILEVRAENATGINILKTRSGFFIKGLGETMQSHKIIDATGISGITQEGKNFLVEWLYGGSFKGSLDIPEMVLIFLPDGGTCWIAPSIQEGYIDAIYTAWGPKNLFNNFVKTGEDRLKRLVQFASRIDGINFSSVKPHQIFRGMIAAQSINYRGPDGIYPFGESAQTSRPASQESFNRILASESILRTCIQRNYPTLTYLQGLSQMQKKDKYMFAGLIARILAHQSR